jgi:hypothetical protein
VNNLDVRADNENHSYYTSLSRSDIQKSLPSLVYRYYPTNIRQAREATALLGLYHNTRGSNDIRQGKSKQRRQLQEINR